MIVPWHLPKEIKHLYPHKNLYIDVCSNFIYNCQNLEETQMSFNEWMDKLWYIQTMEYYSALQINKLLYH